jgi:transposase
VQVEASAVAKPVRVRELSQAEDAVLLRIVRGDEGRQESIRVRRAVMVRACAHGVKPPMIARLLDADPDTVRDVIHAFNATGFAALDPHWAGGRPRRITVEDEAFIVQVATTRPRAVGRPFTHWSLRKLVDYLADNPVRVVDVHRERVRQILHAHDISFPADPDLEGVHRPGRRRQAGPDRAGARAVA